MTKGEIRKIIVNLVKYIFGSEEGTDPTDDYKEEFDEALQAIKKVVEARLETLIKDRYLTKDKLQYQLGWVEGHKVAIKEAKEIIAKLFDTK